MEVFAIYHNPTGTYMPTRMYRARQGGWSHWIPGPPPDGWGGCNGFDKNPRIFFTKRSAQNALTAWLQGIHRKESSGGGTNMFGEPDDYEEDIVIDKPPIERKREDMEIVTLYLMGLV